MASSNTNDQHSQMYQSSDYFAPLLPWQQQAWQQVNQQLTNNSLPHALLASGITGIGKRAFVWRLVAWLLCHTCQSNPSMSVACGECESCIWLQSGTHPSLQVLPKENLPTNGDNDNSNEKNNDGKRSHSKTANTKTSIKIEDIRQLQTFINQGSQGLRICVFDNAEQMTVAAANALLKTLEEPQSNVHLILISDSPATLLPTIKSRVQQLPLQQINHKIAKDYIYQQLQLDSHLDDNQKQVQQLLRLANGAPLAAINMAHALWYEKRQVWLTTWLALRSGKRQAIVASDYWQTQLDLLDFIKLTELMLTDIQRVTLGLEGLQTDCNISQSVSIENLPSQTAQEFLMNSIANSKQAIQQNVQEKFAYDKLMHDLAQM